MINNLPHLHRPIRIRRNPRHERPIPPRHLLPISEVARPRQIPGINSIANHDVEPLLCRRSTETHGIPGIDVALRTPRRQEHVFFDAEIAEAREVAAVPGEVRVGVAETWYQCAAATVEDTDFWILE